MTRRFVRRPRKLSVAAADIRARRLDGHCFSGICAALRDRAGFCDCPCAGCKRATVREGNRLLRTVFGAWPKDHDCPRCREKGRPCRSHCAHGVYDSLCPDGSCLRAMGEDS